MEPSYIRTKRSSISKSPWWCDEPRDPPNRMMILYGQRDIPASAFTRIRQWDITTHFSVGADIIMRDEYNDWMNIVLMMIIYRAGRRHMSSEDDQRCDKLEMKCVRSHHLYNP